MKRKAVFFMGRNGIYPFMHRVSFIQSKLENSIFGAISPTPAEVNIKLAQLRVLQDEIQGRNLKRINQRNELRKAIERMVAAQCLYVNAIADGDLNIIVESGFELNKVRGHRPAPTTGNTPNTAPMGNGEVIIKATGIKNHDYIELQVDGLNGFSKTYSGLYSKFIINDLPVGIELKARTRGVNCRGEGEWTGSVSFIVYGSAQKSHINQATA